MRVCLHFVRAAAPILAVALAGCGGDGGDSDNSDPALNPADCPKTATGLTLEKVAPFWDGLVSIRFDVPGGRPAIARVETLNPALGTWASYGGNAQELEDGSFFALISPQVIEETKDSEFKVRVRPELSGCPAVDWAVSEGFTLDEPLRGTKWSATFESDSYEGSLEVFPNGKGTATGPYSLDPQKTFQHTVALEASGRAEEVYEFSVASGHKGDLYAGCSFRIVVTGDWAIHFEPYPKLFVSDRKVAASLSGSSCSAPKLSDLRIGHAGQAAELPATSIGLSVDYTRLAYIKPGAPTYDELSQLASDFSSILSLLSDDTGVDTASVNGNIYVYQSRYEQQ